MPTAQTTSADIVPQPVEGRGRTWWQFSLFSLLLLLLAAAAIAAWFGEFRRRQVAERDAAAVKAEMRELRTAVGLTDDQPNVLNIADPNLVHVKGVFAHGDLAWRWRIYLPPGKQWNLNVTQGAIWDERRQRYMDQGAGGSRLPLDGEFTLEAHVARALDGSPRIELRTWKNYQSTSISEAALATLSTNGKTTARWTGLKKQESFPNQGRIDLLRLHRECGDEFMVPMTRARTLFGNVEPLPEYGLAIYLEERGARLPRPAGGASGQAAAAQQPGPAPAGK